MRARRLNPEQRDSIARDAVQRYKEGATWVEIGTDFGVTGEHVRRLTVARYDVVYRRWGQKAVADVEEVCRRRDAGESQGAIAEALGCSRQAVRTALEKAGRRSQTRYPRLSLRRRPTPAEVEQILALYESCPFAPRSRPGARYVHGDEGRRLAEACQELVNQGVPMSTLSRAVGRGDTWMHWLLKSHDLQPEPHEVRSTSRRTREVP